MCLLSRVWKERGMFKEFVYVTHCVALRQFFFSVLSLLTVNTSFCLLLSQQLLAQVKIQALT